MVQVIVYMTRLRKSFYWYRIWDVDSGILVSICWVDLLFVIQCDDNDDDDNDDDDDDDDDDDTVVIIEPCLLGLGSAGVTFQNLFMHYFCPILATKLA